ncbi:hypothetical protein [Pontibacter chinhatensis]|uniref:Uncharacterized protein n=1 Tax=Pontibacter chinhatensis TaxID=1436961 RepID=A0A1I2X3T9_9BACT|nr:hypothetical protein [Pontibacter chinhatensis]SFH08195.1 hypothetical protein SAMN05421739_105370 [Pontibacter chinhatensis]
MRTKLLASFLFISTLLSCGPDKESTPVPTPEPVKTFDFSFRYDTYLKAKDYELILSDKDGKVLLDTLLAVNSNHSLSVKSEDTKHDLTTILLDSTNNICVMETFLQVNPDKWHLNFSPTTSSTSFKHEKAEIIYTSVPYDRNFHFRTKYRFGSGYTASWPGNNFVIKDFDRAVPTDLAYILLPSHGLYLFTELTSSQTTADFSEAGKTEKRKYKKPSNVTDYKTNLVGFTKAGDPDSRLDLYWSNFYPSEEYDLQFPPTGIEEFDLGVSYEDADGYFHNYHYSGKQIPTEIDFSTTSDFTVSKSEFDDFMISFTTDKPDIYNSHWVAIDPSHTVNWIVYGSSDVTSYRLKTFLEGLKSKKFAGLDLPQLELLTVSTLKFKNHTYQEYLNIKANASLSSYNKVEQSRLIMKTFKIF